MREGNYTIIYSESPHFIPFQFKPFLPTSETTDSLFPFKNEILEQLETQA